MVDSNKTVFLDNTAVLLVTTGVYTTMKIIPKDSFGNQAEIEENLVHIEIKKVSHLNLKLLCKYFKNPLEDNNQREI